MGKKRIIAETGAGQHGVATATVAARAGLECVIYMGAVDAQRQSLNVTRMKMLGAKVVEVTAGQQTLKEAINEAMRDWVTNVRTTHYILGTAYGAHPYPMMVRDFHRVIGDEARRQILEKENRLPDLLVACVGGGSNAIGLFWPFLKDPSVKMVGIEAGGRGIRDGDHAARFQGGKLGVLQGAKSWLLADEDGQIQLYPFRLRGPRLRRGGAGALLSSRPRQSRLRLCHGRRSAGRFPPTRPHRGHYSGPGVFTRRGSRHQNRARHAPPKKSSSSIFRAAGTRM